MKKHMITSLVILMALHALNSENDVFDQIHFSKFIKQYCSECHNENKQKGKLNLEPFKTSLAHVDQDQLFSLFDQIHLEEMPPEDESLPSQDLREKVLAYLKEQLHLKGLASVDKKLLPGYGNYINHDELFNRDVSHIKASTQKRLWRMTPETFSEFANKMGDHDIIRRRDIDHYGLKHPAFPYLGPLHVAKNYAAIHDFGQTTTEILIPLAKKIAKSQLNRGNLKGYYYMWSGAKEWEEVIDQQFLDLYNRKPSESEKHELLKLQERVSKITRKDEVANLAMITATYLRPETLFRYELGAGEKDEYGRQKLSADEYIKAVGYSLNREGPTQAMFEAFKDYKNLKHQHLKGRLSEFVKSDATHARLMRFMAEYFEYRVALDVFKDIKRDEYHPERLVNDMEEFVGRLVKKDQDVLKHLLTSNEYHVRGLFNTDKAAGYEQNRHNGYKHYHQLYNLKEEQLGKNPSWIKFSKRERSGVLTHPAWLIAFSDNEKNHAIQRGRWVQMKLLGGVVPDAPIEVDAKLPADPKLSLREKMKVVRHEDCWGCHQKMDPLGLPFEQYNLFGQFRTQELGRPVVTTGVLNGAEVKDSMALIKTLSESKKVQQVFLRYVFRFFMGRNETLLDAPTLQNMDESYEQHGGSLKAAIVSLLSSDSFIYRTFLEEQEDAKI